MAGEQLEFVYSGDKTKRYAYRHTWNATGPHVLWVMLNPGTGETENRRRNTLERCISWSKQWGYGGLLIGNVSAVRAKSAKELKSMRLTFDPINQEALRVLRLHALETVVAWGGKGAVHAEACLHLLEGSVCLAVTAKGEPKHPLYLPANSERKAWPVANRR